jgi:CRP/FNR family transcriptional regulator
MDNFESRYFYKCKSLYTGLSEEILKKLKIATSVKQISKGELIFKEGEYSDGLYRLIKGKVKIYQFNADGKYQIVYLYTSGEFFGFRPILSNTKHAVSAEALETSEIEFVSKKHFSSLCNESLNFNKNLLEALSYEFNVWVNITSTFAHKSAKQRIAFVIVFLSEKFKRKESDTAVFIDIGREDLASFAGTTTETCVRMLSKMKVEKLVASSGRKIKIINMPKILELAEI